jgi:hypothetical protein
MCYFTCLSSRCPDPKSSHVPVHQDLSKPNQIHEQCNLDPKEKIEKSTKRATVGTKLDESQRRETARGATAGRRPRGRGQKSGGERDGAGEGKPRGREGCKVRGNENRRDGGATDGVLGVATKLLRGGPTMEMVAAAGRTICQEISPLPYSYSPRPPDLSKRNTKEEP